MVANESLYENLDSLTQLLKGYAKDGLMSSGTGSDVSRDGGGRRIIDLIKNLPPDILNASSKAAIDIPPLKSKVETISLLIAYSIIVVVSLFGNLMVCYVVVRHRRLHTVTYFFIANLALSDLSITIFNIPFNVIRTVMDDWPFSGAICHVVNYTLMICVYVSTFTMTAIAIDRHRVIVYPLKPRMTINCGLIVIFITWILGFLLSLPFVIYAKVETVDFFFKTVRRCRLDYPEPAAIHEKYVTLYTVLAQYLIPMVTVAMTYGQIVRTLWSRTMIGQPTNDQQLRHARAKKKTIKMLICVVCIFGVCWLPLNLYHVLTDLHPKLRHTSAVYLACHWIAMSSVSYNPFIYCWLNDSFRSVVRSKFRCLKRKKKRIYPGVEFNGFLIRRERAPAHVQRRLAEGERQGSSDHQSASCSSTARKLPHSPAVHRNPHQAETAQQQLQRKSYRRMLFDHRSDSCSIMTSQAREPVYVTCFSTTLTTQNGRLRRKDSDGRSCCSSKPKVKMDSLTAAKPEQGGCMSSRSCELQMGQGRKDNLPTRASSALDVRETYL